MNRRLYQISGISLLILAFLLFIILLHDVILPRASGTLLATLLDNGQPQLFQIDVATGVIRRFVEPPLITTSGAVSADGQRVAFPNVEGDLIRIDIMKADGTDRHTLTTGPRDFEPRWSPDGKKLVFVRYLTYTSAIYLVDVETGIEHQLTDFANDLEPDWSPDGQRLIFTTSRDGFQELYSMNADGRDLQRLTENDLQNDLQAVYSPNGAYIAYMSNYSVGDGTGEIWLMKANGSDQRRLTNNDRDDRSPMWSADSTKLLFTSSTRDRVEHNIMRYDLTTDELEPIVQGSAYFPVWSPDDRWIVFLQNSGSARTLYLMSSDGSELRPVFNDPDLEIVRPLIWLP